MALSKINFQNGTIVRSNFLNEIQKGSTFSGINRADYYSEATETEQLSWNIGQRDGLKDWELDSRFGLGSVAASGRVNKWEAIPDTSPTQYQGVAGTPGVLLFNPTTGLPSVDPYISINQGSFVDNLGVKRQWPTTSLAIKDNQTNYVYYRYDSSSQSWGFTYSLNGFPTSETLHIPIAKITVSNGSIPVSTETGDIFFDGGFVDYRQGSYSAYLNAYSSQLVNTDIKISDYQAKNLDRVLCDTSSGSFIVTLPESPEDGTRIAISDLFGTFDQFPIVIKAYEAETDGIYTPLYTINGSSDNWIINTKNSYLALFYSELTKDWRFEDLPLDAENGKLGQFISCGGREVIPNITSAETCPTGQNIPSSYPNPSLGTYFWDSTQQVCYAEIKNSVALYGDGTASGSIKEFNARRCSPEDVQSGINSNKRNILYVDPIIGNDSIENDGGTLSPFRTIERAILEGVRRSYRRGIENDVIDSIAIQLAPGDYYIDNRPGTLNINEINTLSLSDSGLIAPQEIANTEIIEGYSEQTGYFVAELPGTSSIDLTQYAVQVGRVIYSSSGGVGTISRMKQVDVNSTRWRVYVDGVAGEFNEYDSLSYDALHKFNPSTGGLVLPRGISINGLDLRKVKIRPIFVPSVASGVKTAMFKVTGNTYVSQLTFADNKQFNYSHSNITAIEYASKCELVGVSAQLPNGTTPTCSGELQYYSKISKVFKVIDNYPVNSSQEGRIDEWSIVTAAFVNRDQRYTDNIINLTGEDNLYNDNNEPSQINDLTSFPSSIPGPAIDTNSAFFGLGLPDINSTRSSSPYVFNCSVRSIYGMNGMHADGSKVEGLRSMVVAQFTQVSLQVDPNAFDGPYLPSTPSADRDKVFRQAYRHFGFKASNDAYIQIVSCFVIGNADHFISESGGDLSITNSCSDFGDISLKAVGYKTVAFSQDVRRRVDFNDNNATHISDIIPPKPLSGTYISIPDETQAGNISTGLTIDRALTLSRGSIEGNSGSGRIYLSPNYNSRLTPPSASTLAGGNKYSYTKNGIELSGPTEYQKIFIGGKTAPNNNNSIVTSVSSSGTSFSSSFSTNSFGFIRKVISAPDGQSNSTTEIFINSITGIIPNQAAIYFVNGSNVGTTSNITTITTIGNSTKITISSALPSAPAPDDKLYIYITGRSGGESCIRTTSQNSSSSNGITTIYLSDTRGIMNGDIFYGPYLSSYALVTNLSVSTPNQDGTVPGSFQISGTLSSNIPQSANVFVGVRQDTSTIPLRVKVFNTDFIDSTITSTNAYQFSIRARVSKLSDRSNFIIDSVEYISGSSGGGFKVPAFNITANVTGNIRENYPSLSSFGDGTSTDITNYIYDTSYESSTGLVGSPGYIEGAILNVRVTVDPGQDTVYFANLTPPVVNSVDYYQINTGEFVAGANPAIRPDLNSRVFGWDANASNVTENNPNAAPGRWFIRVAPSGDNNTILSAIDSIPSNLIGVTPLISNFSSIYLRRKIDRRSADQRIYRVKVKGFRDSVRKPLSGYIVQASSQQGNINQNDNWIQGDDSKAFIVADVQDKLDGVSLPNGEYILTILRLIDSSKVVSKDYYPNIDYDNPIADSSSATKDAISEFVANNLAYNYRIKNSDGSNIALTPQENSFGIKRLFDVSTLSLAYCELRRPSLIRATNHTWEWVGYLNYDTALPSLQGNSLTENDKLRKILTEINGGRVYATGMDEDGLFRIGSFVYDLKVNKQFDISLPAGSQATGTGAGNISVQSNGAILSNTINSLNFTGDGLVTVDGSIASISLSSNTGEINGSRIINGTITPNKLDTAYVRLSGDTLTGRLLGTDFEASGTIQSVTLKFGSGFANIVGTNATGNKTISTSAPTSSTTGNQGDVWYVV